ncbi:hypothetical protein NFI96_012031 [Prochilodus magdalenae]|nr:hypothetical protein NFI96_012031 [Prochilodus magdalenae]
MFFCASLLCCSMERAFNFKLLVPPRTSLAQVSAVKPQDSFEDSNSCLTPVQGYNKSFDKEINLPFSNTNMVLPTKSPRAEVAKKIAVLPMEKEEVTSVRCSQLYSNLFEEAEKIKSWKMKMDSEILQKNRKLQQNRKTIDTQRKAIQELQFGNESLSMKLEELLNENEDLRNKNNATRNLCNILKDTFERSTEKMSLFEAEREEAHGLFLQNHKNIERMIGAFENLRMQAEADQLEMLNVREGLKQFEDLKLRFENEYHIKEKEVSILEKKLNEKESDLKEILLSLQETQQGYCELQESAKQHQELLQNSKQEHDKLEEKLKRAEQHRQETEEQQQVLAHILEQSQENYAKSLQVRDAKLEEVNNIKEQLAHKLKETTMTIESLQCSLTSEKQKNQDLELKHSSISEELNKKNAELGKIREEKEEQDNQIQLLKNELDLKSNAFKSLEEKAMVDRGKLLQLTTEQEEKQTEISELKKKLEIASTENKNVAVTLEQAINEQKEIKEYACLTENKLRDTEVKLSEALKNESEASSNIKILKKDLDQHKEKYDDLLERFHQLQLQKNTTHQEAEGDASETKVLESCLTESKENEENMKMKVERIKEEKQQLQKQLEVLNAKIEEQRQDCKNIQEQFKEAKKSCEKLCKNELMKRERHIKAQDVKLTNLKTKLQSKTKALDEQLKENKAVNKEMALKNEKLVQHENEITQLKDELHYFKEQYEEEHMTVCSELRNKTTSEAQLTVEKLYPVWSLQVQKLKQTAVEAVKSKEDTETKCQQKISDMIALMERHKHEYDKMVEEKDAELNEKRMREAEVNANKTSLELELSHLRVENGQLKQHLEKVTREKENVQQKMEKLTKMQTTQKDSYKEKEERLEQEILALKKQIKCFEKDKTQKISVRTPKDGKSSETPDVASTKMSACIFSKRAEVETPLKNDLATPLKLCDNLLATPTWTLETKIGQTPRIRSFRIRTPPSVEKSAPWRKSTLELDPKSDSSEHNDTRSFCPVPSKTRKTVQAKGYETECLNLLKKVQSSSVCKSPGAALKLAAMKRMRDAGWTTITGSDKKKKKGADKIFA